MMRRRDISAWTQGSSSTGQSLRHVAILYSLFQSWFSVNTSLINTCVCFFFFFSFSACCTHIPSKITWPRGAILVCEYRDLIHFRMKWASSVLMRDYSGDFDRATRIQAASSLAQVHTTVAHPCRHETRSHT